MGIKDKTKITNHNSKSLPHNVKLEADCLGSILIGGLDTYKDVCEKICANDFYTERHIKIFEAMEILQTKGKPTVMRPLLRQGD